MWRRTYFLLLVVRVYLALSPSYIHPDENFQGPEIIAGDIFSYPSLATWEFTSSKPIRSFFPIWLAYGLPMTLLKSFWSETLGNGATPPYLVYYVLRGALFGLSLVLEDWAIYELVTSPRRRRQAVVLMASSYVTWTYQTHTFSNSLETVLVAWALVLIRRILEEPVWNLRAPPTVQPKQGYRYLMLTCSAAMQQHNFSGFNCVAFSFVGVLGVFNRMTFPAFIVIPALPLVAHFSRRPLSLAFTLISGLFFAFAAVYVDTNYYANSPASIMDVFRRPVITPINNLLYNSDPANLVSHGIHPRYQHLLVNLPQLLGPAYIFMAHSLWPWAQFRFFDLRNSRAISALSGAIILSILPHQEARFLMPCVPLLLTCFRPPRYLSFLVPWVLFNSLLGTLMGVYHQGGVVPTQIHIPTLLGNSISSSSLSTTASPSGTANVFWWKTYSPPLWLLGESGTANLTIQTHDLMGISGPEMLNRIEQTLPKCISGRSHTKYPAVSDYHGNNNAILAFPDSPTLLVAPSSSTFLDAYIRRADDDSVVDRQEVRLYELWKYKRHLNLDDMDFAEDGVFNTVKRVLGRRGLSVFIVSRGCA